MSEEKISAFMPTMGVMGSLRESSRILSRMGKLAIFLTLFLIAASSIIYVANVFALKPLLADIASKSYYLHKSVRGTPQHKKLRSEIVKDVGFLVGQEVIFVMADDIVSLLTIAATIYASAVTYSGKQLSFKDIVLRIRSVWKRLLITWLCITLFKTGYLFFLTLFIGLTVMTTQGSMLLPSLVFVIASCGLVCYLYLVLIWFLGIVISVVEDGYQGFSAFGKVGELITGRKVHGFALSLVCTMATLAISWFLSSHMRKAKYSEKTRIGMGIILVAMSSLMTLYSTVVYTVFYYVCKESKGEEIELRAIGGYSLLPTALVDASVP
ncbi:hypothetical protein H6P81_000542 [Aristolochia fimbriata]|uniref:Uncharacterized protein n=1 Tax=Aristolochia fimbriata TaxID=158543 RepID=A0AAV7F5R2_ARIFI|nr:hypothetical protein H6P81_000542 [Aristolochia fimbriata]